MRSGPADPLQLPAAIETVLSMTTEERLARLEDAVLQIAELRDPSRLAGPIIGSDRRARALNAAEQRLAEIASSIQRDRR